MHTTRHITALVTALLLGAALHAAPPAAFPSLPGIVPYYDSKAYAWAWDTPAQAWRLLPRNEARILDHGQDSDKQLTGTLWIDGDFEVPVVSGRDVLLLFRKKGEFQRFEGLPATESGIEVARLDVRDGNKKGQLIRTARLQRWGEAAATLGARREPLTVWKFPRKDGVFHVVRVDRVLPPGRYALYLPDRAFEFEVR